MKRTTNWRQFLGPVAAGIVAAAALGSAIGPCAAGQESAGVPPARPPQVPLTLDGHATKVQRAEVYEGRRVLVDGDSFPRTPARLVEGATVRRDGNEALIAFALDKPDDVLVPIVDAQGHYPEPEIAFAWVHSIDTFGDFLYAGDKDTRRVVKVRLDYRELEEVAIP